MKSSRHIHILDDSATCRARLNRACRRCGEINNFSVELFVYSDFDEFMDNLTFIVAEGDLIIIDYLIGGCSGLDIVQTLDDRYEGVPPLILATGYTSIDAGIKDAYYFVKSIYQKPINENEFIPLIQSLLNPTGDE